MSTHKECGEPIKWIERPDEPGRYYPPMESAGEVFVLIDGVLTEKMALRQHRCDVDKVLAWQEYLATMAEVKGDDSYEGRTNAYVAARERDREKMLEYAQRVACPLCDADTDQPCRNLTILKKTGEIQPTRNPHPARIKHADAWAREEEPAWKATPFSQGPA